MLRIFYHPKAAKELLRVPGKFRHGIIADIEALSRCNHPLQYKDVKKLHGCKQEDFRLRSGDFRIRFTLRNGNDVFITRIRQRQGAYK